jgi:hypothetical protein
VAAATGGTRPGGTLASISAFTTCSSSLMPEIRTFGMIAVLALLTAYLVDASQFSTPSNLFWGVIGSLAIGLGIAGRKGVRIERAVPFWNP